MKHIRLLLFVIIIISLLLSCSKKTTEPDVLQPVVSDNTIVVGNNVQNPITGVTDTEVIITGDNPEQYQVGSVIVSGITAEAPNGLLRKVLNKQINGDQVILTTENARLEDAFDQLELNITQSLKTTDIKSSNRMSKGVTFHSDAKNPYVFNYDIDEEFELGNNVTMYVTGNLNLTLGYDFQTQITLLQGLKYLKFEGYVTSNGNLEMETTGNFNYEDEIELYQHNFAPITFVVPTPIGPFPIILVPKVVVILNIDAYGTATVTASVTTSANASAGVIYNKPDWSTINNKTVNFNYTPPDLSASMNAVAGAGPRFEVNLYGIAGPFARAKGYLELDANVNSTPWWTLRGRFTVDAGVEFEVLGYVANYTVPNIINYSTLIAQAPQNQGQTPTFNPAAGTYSPGQTVTITCATSGATIYYTTNGNEPTTSSTVYSAPLTLQTGTTTVKAKAFKTDMTASQTASATYTISSSKVATPTFNPAGGPCTSPINVTIACATAGASIFYTTGSGDPTTPYTGAITISTTTTIKAKATKSGMQDSDIATATYTFGVTPSQFVYVPGGTFTMGDTRGAGYSYELPTHSVTLNSFYISKYEVTQAEYSQYMQPGNSWTSTYGLGDNYPAYYISWYAILKYCNLRSIAEGKTPVYSISGFTNPANWGTVPTSSNATWDAVICNWSANGYRLPTEAEWEYAARGGQNIPDYLYSGSDDINAVAWYSGNNTPSGSKPVGGKAANGLGLYDMSGNVWEWCWDWFSSSYYSVSPVNNPTGPTSGTYHSLRGGDWNDNTYCRVSNRNSYYYPYSGGAYNGSYDVGFRIVRAN